MPPFRWRAGRHARLLWAEQLPSGRVYLVAARDVPDGVALRATGHRASEVEQLAPLAARARRALWLDTPHAGPRPVRATTLFEDCVKQIAANATTVRALAVLGRRCPASPSLRTFPDASILAALGTRGLRAQRVPALCAARIVALARAVVAGLDLTSLDRSRRPPTTLRRRLARLPGLDGALACALVPLLDGFRRPGTGVSRLRAPRPRGSRTRSR